MVDGVHSTDLGMQQYADSYLKKIREILHEKNEGPTSCIPCKQMAPVLKTLNNEWQGKAAVQFIGTRVMKKSLN